VLVVEGTEYGASMSDIGPLMVSSNGFLASLLSLLRLCHGPPE
jgi:hypothetical protein